MTLTKVSCTARANILIVRANILIVRLGACSHACPRRTEEVEGEESSPGNEKCVSEGRGNDPTPFAPRTPGWSLLVFLLYQ